MIQSILNRIYFGNSIYDYILSAGIFLVCIICVIILKKIILTRLKRIAEKTSNRIDDFIILQLDRFAIPLLYLGAMYMSVMALNIPAGTKKFVDSVSIVVITFFAVRFILLIINYSIKHFWQKKENGKTEPASIKGMSTFISIVVWGLGLVFLLDNLGFKVSAVMAGLGISGIAVALAAQAVLGDFFSYFVIFFDRPFQIGDFISVDDKSGTIEKIGIKTTRVVSLSGEQIIFPNSNLTNSRIHNYNRMQKRRVVFKIGVTYQTSLKSLKEIPGIIRSIIESNDNVVFDRSHFASYAESSIIFETVYNVNTPDYTKFMDIQQTVNLKLYEEFEKRGISLAYPTRTLFLERSAGPEAINKAN